MSHQVPPPASDDAIDPAKPTLVFNHAGTSSSNSFIYQVRLQCLSLTPHETRSRSRADPRVLRLQFRDPRLREALNLVSLDSRYYGRTGGEPLDHFQTLEVRC